MEWESLSVDLLPHPDMFMDARMASSSNQGNKRDADGAKRLFFGGERFLEGISGEAHVMQYHFLDIKLNYLDHNGTLKLLIIHYTSDHSAEDRT